MLDNSIGETFALILHYLFLLPKISTILDWEMTFQLKCDIKLFWGQNQNLDQQHKDFFVKIEK